MNPKNPEAIRTQILALVKEYYTAKFAPKSFDPDKGLVHYAGRVFDAEELTYLIDASLDFFLTASRYAERFESEFAEYLGLSNALLVNSGSSANLVALTALTSPKLGERCLKPGDEVITTACGFPTTLNHKGYASIRSTQQTYFEGRFVGSEASSGLTLPDTSKIAAAYNLPFVKITSHANIMQKVKQILETPGPVVCDVKITENQFTAPRISSSKRADGTMESKSMEDLWPFLDREEFESNMISNGSNISCFLRINLIPH